MPTLNELARQVARMGNIVTRAVVGITNTMTGNMPEAMTIEDPSAPSMSLPAVCAPWPGAAFVSPPLCQIIIVSPDGDPVVIGGAPLPPALAAMAPLLAEVQAKGGGVVIVDPVTGTGGLVITPDGVDIRGALSVNGVGVP